VKTFIKDEYKITKRLNEHALKSINFSNQMSGKIQMVKKKCVLSPYSA
jgi:hypothetical protein